MTLENQAEVRRISLGVKVIIEELQKQDYAAVEIILREVDRRLDQLAIAKSSAA